MNLHNINVIAGYEVKLLKRSWLFRVFAILALLILTLMQLSMLTPVFWKYQETWNYTAVSSLIPFYTIYLYNIAQSVIVIFLAGSFLKRDKKLDTAEVIYVRPMSNADYIVGKVWGIVRTFLGLNLIVFLIAIFINLVVERSPFSIFPYLFYLLTISLPSLLFILGLSFTMMCLLKNQAVTFIVMLGITGTIFFYLPESLNGVFDFFGVNIPAIFSDVTGHADIGLFLFQRLIYLLLGIGFICLTITLVKRLPHRPWKTIVLTGAAIILILTGVCTGLLYTRHFTLLLQIRAEYAAVYNKYAGTRGANVISNDINVEQAGKQLEASCRMLLRNNGNVELKHVILYLNPALQITQIESGGKEQPFTRDKQAVIIDRPLQPGEELPLSLKYIGRIDEDVCYTDIEDKDFLANPRANTFTFRYGKRYAYLSDKFTQLTPECLWYPLAEPPAYPAIPYNVKKDFTRYTLTVKDMAGRTVVSQGEPQTKEGETTFINNLSLPGISLTIADYEKKAITVDSTDYELYYFRGHDYFSKYFKDLQDTLPAVIKAIRNDLEVKKNRSYPFRKFVIAETPVQFTGYIRNWKGYTEQVMPEIVFVPERGITTKADFRSASLRTRDWRRQDDVLEDKDVQIEMLKNYVQSTFVSESSSDGDMQWSSSPEVNKLNMGAMFFGFTGFIYSPEYPVVDAAVNMLQNTTSTTMRRWNFNRGLTDVQRANLYLQENSFKTALADRDMKPQVFYEILKLKSNFLKNYITAQVPLKEFNAFMKQFNDSHSFVEVPFTVFAEAFTARFGIDLVHFMDDWYTVGYSPNVTLKDVDANKVLIDDFTKYQIRFKAYNNSDVNAIITVKIQSGGGGRGGFRMMGGGGQEEDNSLNYIIPAKSAREIRIINDDRPGNITVNTNISHNLPNEFNFNFSKVDNEVSDTTTGLFPIDTFLFALKPTEIIIDNEDPGFRIIEADNKRKLQELFRKEEKDKYTSFFPWRFPSKWTAVIGSNCYGNPVNSAVHKNKGKGVNKVEWTVQLPKDNYYDVAVWNPKFETWGRRRHDSKENQTQTYTIKYDTEEEEISVDLGQEENGWVSLGSFYLPKGEVTIILTDKVTAGFVMADAVKFTMINNN